MSSRPRTAEGGSTAVEAVVLIPVAMVIVLLVVQACLWAEADSFVAAAALQGAQAASVSGGTNGDGLTEARSMLEGSAHFIVVDPSVEVSTLAGDVVLVQITGEAESILPWVKLSVSAVRTSTRQEFRPGA